MRFTRCLLLGSAAVAVGAFALTGISAATTPATSEKAIRPAARHLSASFVAEARTALTQYLRDNHPQIELVHPGSVNLAASSLLDSFNWSGYADVSSTNGTFTEVSGKWITPRVRCTPEDTISAQWVGLDGATNATVEQDGTVAWCFEDQPVYFTWYEMYPAGLIEVGTTLEPGDVIAASVSRTGASYTLAVTDVTRRSASFSTTATCATTVCLDTSAEWIMERPAYAIGIAPLADYSFWALADGTQATGGRPGPISAYPTVDQIDMQDATGTYNLTTTSGLFGGSAFSTTWNNSY